MTNLRSLDLNLLVVLQALIEERHVTRAARRLSLSQSATSNALERCRHVFKDPLLERVSGEMRLTSKAISLIEPLDLALSAISVLVDDNEVDLFKVNQTIRLVMADQPGLTAIISLLDKLKKDAPNLSVILYPWHGNEDAINRLRNGEVDIVVSTFSELSEEFNQINLRKEAYIVAMRKEHPASKEFGLNEWLSWPHVVVSGKGSIRGGVEKILANNGKIRHVGAVVPSFMMVEPLLKNSNMISTIPKSIISDINNIKTFTPPIYIPSFDLKLAWHKRKDKDIVVKYIVEILSKSFK